MKSNIASKEGGKSLFKKSPIIGYEEGFRAGQIAGLEVGIEALKNWKASERFNEEIDGVDEQVRILNDLMDYPRKELIKHFKSYIRYLKTSYGKRLDLENS